jgi:hypothetical protein
MLPVGAFPTTVMLVWHLSMLGGHLSMLGVTLTPLRPL